MVEWIIIYLHCGIFGNYGCYQTWDRTVSTELYYTAKWKKKIYIIECVLVKKMKTRTEITKPSVNICVYSHIFLWEDWKDPYQAVNPWGETGAGRKIISFFLYFCVFFDLLQQMRITYKLKKN